MPSACGESRKFRQASLTNTREKSANFTGFRAITYGVRIAQSGLVILKMNFNFTEPD